MQAGPAPLKKKINKQGYLSGVHQIGPRALLAREPGLTMHSYPPCLHFEVARLTGRSDGELPFHFLSCRAGLDIQMTACQERGVAYSKDMLQSKAFKALCKQISIRGGKTAKKKLFKNGRKKNLLRIKQSNGHSLPARVMKEYGSKCQWPC